MDVAANPMMWMSLVGSHERLDGNMKKPDENEIYAEREPCTSK